MRPSEWPSARELEKLSAQIVRPILPSACFGDGKAVAGRIEIVSNLKFVDLSVLHQDFAFGRDDDGAIVDSLAVALGEAGRDVDSRLSVLLQPGDRCAGPG